MNKVIAREIHQYDLNALIEIFTKEFDTLGICEEIKEGMTVVIKPNLVMKSNPDKAIITHPNVVAAVGVVVKSLGAKVLIAESSGGLYTPPVCSSVFSGCGYKTMAEEHGFELYTKCDHQQVELKDGEICKTLNVVEPFINADYIINVCKLKSHCMTKFSGATKNIFGTVPGLMKPELHCRYPEEKDFVKMIVDLCEYVKPNLSIMDGIDAMEGDGPTGGRPRHVGFLGISKSTYALDFIGATIANMDPKSVLMLENAMNRGLCPKSMNEIEVVGDVEKLIQKDFLQPRSKSADFIDKLPKFMRPAVKKIATPKPVIKKSNCIGCGKCAESCPQKTIDIIDKKAVINYSDCIKCFCCHEMCPVHTIDVKRFSLFNL